MKSAFSSAIVLLSGLALSALFFWEPESESAAGPAAGATKRPTGLFVCRGPGPTPDREVNFPFIHGWLVRPGWKEVEAEDGHYDWSHIEAEVAAAKRLGKRIALCIRAGPHTPEWVYQAGAREFRYVTASRYRPKKAVKMPLPWDEVYLRKWTALIRAAGKRFGQEKTVVLVHMTSATSNGLEMQIPSAYPDRKQWQAVGYAPAKVVVAWKRVIDTFAKAFPDTPLDVDIHPVLGSDRIANEVTAHGHERLGKRFGVFGGWLSGKSAVEDRIHSGMHPFVRKYAQLGFAGFQLIGNETRQPQRFAAGGIKAAIEQGMNWGADYFEVWQTDAMNPRLHDTLKELSARIKKGAR